MASDLKELLADTFPYELEHPDRPLHYFNIHHDGISFHVVRMPVLPNMKEIGKVLFVHGWAESTLMYYRAMEFFASLGYECYAYDQRGQGKSLGSLGDANQQQTYTDLDGLIIELFGDFDKPMPEYTYTLVGHSMGGGIALGYAYFGKQFHFDNVIVTSPLVATHPSTHPSWWKYWLLSALCMVLPGIEIAPQEKNISAVTRNAAWQQYMMSRPPVKGTLRFFRNLLQRSAQLRQKIGQPFTSEARLLILQAANDSLVDENVLKRFFEQSPSKDKEFHLVPNTGHALFIDTDDTFAYITKHITAFMNK